MKLFSHGEDNHLGIEVPKIKLPILWRGLALGQLPNLVKKILQLRTLVICLGTNLMDIKMTEICYV